MPQNLIDRNDLASARATVLGLMPDLCDIYTPSRTEDQQGGFAETYILSYSDVRCRLGEVEQTRFREEGITASRMDVVADYMLTLPFDQEITEDMRIQHQGQDYTIATVNAQRSYDTARRCLVRRLQ